jgi:hypothetical protein
MLPGIESTDVVTFCRPITDVGGENGPNILKHVWDNRSTMQDTITDMQLLFALKETRNMMEAYPNLSRKFLERELTRMLKAVRFHVSKHVFCDVPL